MAAHAARLGVVASSLAQGFFWAGAVCTGLGITCAGLNAGSGYCTLWDQACSGRLCSITLLSAVAGPVLVVCATLCRDRHGSVHVCRPALCRHGADCQHCGALRWPCTRTCLQKGMRAMLHCCHGACGACWPFSGQPNDKGGSSITRQHNGVSMGVMKVFCRQAAAVVRSIHVCRFECEA